MTITEDSTLLDFVEGEINTDEHLHRVMLQALNLIHSINQLLKQFNMRYFKCKKYTQLLF